MKLKFGTVLVMMMALALSMGYYITNRLSPAALDMAVGVLCGMGASIPVSLGLLLALTRQREREQYAEGEVQDEFRDFNPVMAQAGRQVAPRPVQPQPQQPQIIVIAPPQGQPYPGQAAYGYPMNGVAPYPYGQSMHEDVIDSRDWKIIGDDEG